MTSFTLTLNTGVGGDLFGGVASWNGTSTPATGDGPTSILYTSSAVASPVLPEDQSYTFMPNISVTTGDVYVAYISVAGQNSPDQGATPNVTNGSSVPGIDYFVYNDFQLLYAPWDYAFLLNNAVLTASFNSSVTPTPLPSTWTMLIAGFVGLGFFACRGSKKNAASLPAA